MSCRSWTAILASCALLAMPRARAAESYTEPFRPQFHFTPARNWMNDPNGLVYYDGEYHLFYQHNPSGDKWGHMSWGHAVSRDMVHWEHWPIALREENNVMIFSGSAVVDWKNTSGFGEKGKPPIVAIYTGHYTDKPLQNQQIAYSNDGGRTWVKYNGNPVLDIGEKDFRDPKVFWHEATQRWVMAVAWPVKRQIRFYSSRDLKRWQHLSDFGPAGSTKGIWECPDLFSLGVEGGRGERWVLVVNVGSGAPAGGSGTQYFVGNFDGARFTLDWSYPKGEPEFVPEGSLVVDFEGGDYRKWEATGDAFGAGPARGKLGDQQEISGFRGQGLVNTFQNGDSSQGTLTSPEFEISDDYLSFLIGGGRHPGKVCFNLLVDGQVVRTATGDNDERLSWKSWQIRDLRGKRARLQIVDGATGSWGHITLDHIVFADSSARPASEAALWADFGPDFYAAVSWNDLPKRDGRRVWLGWMSNWQYADDVPTSPWRSAMSIPRELTLQQTHDGPRLFQEPVTELRKLREKRYKLGKSSLVEANRWFREKNISGPGWEMEIELEASLRTDITLKLLAAGTQATLLRYDPKIRRVSLDRTQSGGSGDFHPNFPGTSEAPLRKNVGPVRLRLFIDTSSIEVFVNGGESVISAILLPRQSRQPFEFISPDKSAAVSEINVWKLEPAVPILDAKLTGASRR